MTPEDAPWGLITKNILTLTAALKWGIDVNRKKFGTTALIQAASDTKNPYKLAMVTKLLAVVNADIKCRRQR